MRMSSKTRYLWGAGLFVLVALFMLGLALPAFAAPNLQFTPYPTPTPGPDGRIVYVVQANDSWWRIAAIYGLDLNELLAVNNATRDTVLVEGSEIVLGYGGPVEVAPTAGPSPTPAPQGPTPTPQPGSGTLCVILYNDTNGDSMRQESEPSIPGGKISVSNRTGDVSLTETTTSGLDYQCFKELDEGDYNVSVGIPEGYNPTTVLNYATRLDPGSEIYIYFGAQPSAETVAEEAAVSGSKSPLLAVMGLLLVIGGAGLGAYAGLLRRSRGKPPE